MFGSRNTQGTTTVAQQRRPGTRTDRRPKMHGCYKETRWLGMHQQAGTRAGNHQRHTRTHDKRQPTNGNNATRATNGNPATRLLLATSCTCIEAIHHTHITPRTQRRDEQLPIDRKANRHSRTNSEVRTHGRSSISGSGQCKSTAHSRGIGTTPHAPPSRQTRGPEVSFCHA